MALQDYRGGLGFCGDVLSKIAAKYISFVPAALRAQREKRDGDTYHITVIAPGDYSSEIRTKAQAAIARISADGIDLVDMGLAHYQEGDRETYFVLFHSAAMDAVRDAVGLPAKHFHISVGFTGNDLHSDAKNASCIQTPNHDSIAAILEHASVAHRKYISYLAFAETLLREPSNTLLIQRIRAHIALRKTEALDTAAVLSDAALLADRGHFAGHCFAHVVQKDPAALERALGAYRPADYDEKLAHYMLLNANHAAAAVAPTDPHHRQEVWMLTADRQLQRHALPRFFSFVVGGALAALSEPRDAADVAALREWGMDIGLIVTIMEEPNRWAQEVAQPALAAVAVSKGKQADAPKQAVSSPAPSRLAPLEFAHIPCDNYKAPLSCDAVDGVLLQAARLHAERGAATAVHCGGGKGRTGLFLVRSSRLLLMFL